MKTARTAGWVFLSIALLTAQSSLALTVIGQVETLEGFASATDRDGKPRKLGEGRAIFEGDRVQTADNSTVSLTFKDGTVFDLSENSALSVDKFVYGKSDRADKLSAKILKGAFRFISGLVAKKSKDAMTVQVGFTATIGIRGTNVGGELIGEEAKIVLLEPTRGESDTAIEVYNDFGSVLIDEPGFGTVVVDSKSAPSPMRRMRLRTVDTLIATLRNILKF